MTPPLADKQLPWQARKERALDRIRNSTDRDVSMAFAADKVATLHELELDCQHFGSTVVMARLRGGREQWIWYYQACAQALADKITPRMSSLLQMHLNSLRRQIGHSSGSASWGLGEG